MYEKVPDLTEDFTFNTGWRLGIAICSAVVLLYFTILIGVALCLSFG